MAQCKWCGRSGWFLSVSEKGLCTTCGPTVEMGIIQRLRILQDSAKIISKTQKLDIKLSRWDLFIEQLQALKKYEDRGIPTVPNMSPSKQLQGTEGARDAMVLEASKVDVGAMIKKGDVQTQSKKKIAILTKALLQLGDYKKLLQAKHSAQQIEENENRIKKDIHRLQLNAFLEAAKKAEFKHQNKKALDQYYEALYFLKNDDIDDSLQRGQISKLESKIKALGGEIK